MRLKEITFVFENCDTITIPEKYVGHFIVDDIHTSVKRMAVNAIERVDGCEEFAIEIHKDANKERYQFEQTHIEDFKQMTFNRFTGNDITCIQFTLYDEYGENTDENYDYYVKWTGDSDYDNEAQKVVISDLGHLYIVVSEKPFEEYFEMEEINDEDNMDFHFSVLHIGDENWNKYQELLRKSIEEEDTEE